LKQTQEDPWQRVLQEYRPGDVLEGKVTKVVAFGAFVEIVPGVEGLVHISELAEHHVENPGEVVSPGDQVWVRVLEIDEGRRRISLSVKRAESQNLPLRDLMPPELTGEATQEAAPDDVPDLDVSEEVFPEAPPSPSGDGEVPVAELTPDVPDVPEIQPAEDDPGPVGVPAEQADHSIAADQVAPEEQGPGDSDGEAPAAPE
jgi:small subunit ribosomal protein S1